MQNKRLSLGMIVAYAQRRVIGRGGDMPWSLPPDMRWFQHRTRGATVVMGRRTWQSLHIRPLPDRYNIVLSQQLTSSDDGVPDKVCRDISELLSVLRQRSGRIIVIGGEMLYRALLPYTTRVYVTEIDADFNGDTYFPVLDTRDWQRCWQSPQFQYQKSGLKYQFQYYRRKPVVVA